MAQDEQREYYHHENPSIEVFGEFVAMEPFVGPASRGPNSLYVLLISDDKQLFFIKRKLAQQSPKLRKLLAEVGKSAERDDMARITCRGIQ